MSRQHTGGKWEVVTDSPNDLWRGDGTEIASECGRIAETFCNDLRLLDECQANARRIVQCVNNFDALALALRLHHEWSMRNLPGYSEHGAEGVAYRATALALAHASETDKTPGSAP